MSTIREIFATSDLSPRADRALARAVQLAIRHGARLTVLHVIEPMQQDRTDDWIWPGEDLRKRLIAHAREEAERALRTRLTRLAAGQALSQNPLVVSGTPFLEIIRHAREVNADLVVMGAHGRAFFHELALGTTTERVVRKGQLPVLVVKRASIQAYREVLVATDFSESAAGALRYAQRMFDSVRWQLMHAYEFQYEDRFVTEGSITEQLATLHQRYEQAARDRLKAFAEHGGLSPQTARYLVRHGYAGVTITAAADEQHADVIVIGTRGLTGLPHVLLGSVAEHVLRESHTDVLVVPPSVVEFALP